MPHSGKLCSGARARTTTISSTSSRESRGAYRQEFVKPAKPANPLHDQVYTLRDQGKSTAEISTETGRDIGEIELILGLRDVK